MKLRNIDHIGINFNDLDAAKAFFLDLGFEVRGEAQLEGNWLGKIVGLENVKTEFVMVGIPGAQTTLELIKYISPTDEKGIQPNTSNMLGIRHIATVVDDLDAVLARIKEKGMELIGEIHSFEHSYKTCYCRGPEGVILEFAQEIE